MANSHQIRSALVTVVGCLVSACASAPEEPRATPDPHEIINHHPYSVRVNIVADDKQSIWTSVSDTAYATSVYNALVKSQVFRAVVREGETDFLLDVFAIDIRQPAVEFFESTTKVSANWRLIHVASGRALFHETISTFKTTSVSEIPYGYDRVRLTRDRAINANIAEGIRRLSALDLQRLVSQSTGSQ